MSFAETQLLSSIDSNLQIVVYLLAAFLLVAIIQGVFSIRQVIKRGLSKAVSDAYADLLKEGKYAEALKGLEQSIAKKPKDMQLLWLKGKALFYLERYDEAKVVYERIQDMEPDWLEHAQRYLDRIEKRNIT